jgi:hypothetical protein
MRRQCLSIAGDRKTKRSPSGENEQKADWFEESLRWKLDADVAVIAIVDAFCASLGRRVCQNCGLFVTPENARVQQWAVLIAEFFRVR